MGVIIEDLEEIEGIEDYNLIYTREGNNEYNGLKYLKYVPFFMILINELKEENRIIKEKLNNMKICEICNCYVSREHVDLPIENINNNNNK